MADADDLSAALSDARLSYCVLYAEESESRFPESGWLTGSVSDLADLVRLVSVPQKAVERCRGRTGTGHRARFRHPRRVGCSAVLRDYGDSQPARNGERPPDAPNGVRHPRQRPRLSRAHRRYARRRETVAASVRPRRVKSSGRNVWRRGRKSSRSTTGRYSPLGRTSSIKSRPPPQLVS